MQAANAVATVGVAVFGTAAWAIGLASWRGDVRLALVAAGALAGMTFAVAPLQQPITVVAQPIALGALLLLYQLALAKAVHRYGPSVQAVVNCNVVVIVAVQILLGRVPWSLQLGALCGAAALSAAALVLHGVHDMEIVVPG